MQRHAAEIDHVDHVRSMWCVNAPVARLSLATAVVGGGEALVVAAQAAQGDASRPVRAIFVRACVCVCVRAWRACAMRACACMYV